MSRYLEHVPSGDIYVWTEYLAARADMRPHPGPEPHQDLPSASLWAEGRDEWPDEVAPEPEPEQLPDGGPEPDPDAMTRHELMDYAQAAFGVTLSPRDKKEDLLAQVQALIRERDGDL